MKIKTYLFILFKNMMNIFRAIFRTLTKIDDGAFYDNTQQFYVLLTVFTKRAPSTYDENNNIKTCSINFTICDFDVQTTSSDIFQDTLFAKFFHDISRVFRT